METELKMRFLDPGAREALIADEWFQGLLLPDPPEETHMEATYYDTPDGKLHARRAAFRIRVEGGRPVATLKARGKVAEGLHQRLEWSLEQKDETPDLPAFCRSRALEGDSEDVLREIADAVGDEELEEVCRTEFDRLAMMVGYGDALIEAAFDRGTLCGGDRTEDMDEMELELKEGDVRDLVDLGRSIAERFRLLPEPRSKYHRCMELRGAKDGDED